MVDVVADWRASDWQAARSRYSYPTVCLMPVERGALAELETGDLRLARHQKTSHMALDEYHSEKLGSALDFDRRVGLASVMYWGFYGSSDNRRTPTHARALTRSKWVFDKPTKTKTTNISETLILGVRTAREGRFSEALSTFGRLPNVGFSFASKLVMFCAPTRASVFDAVMLGIFKATPELNRFSARITGHISAEAASTYAMWCDYCTQKADALNRVGLRWSDLDGESHRWRAVDVERALFQLGR